MIHKPSRTFPVRLIDHVITHNMSHNRLQLQALNHQSWLRMSLQWAWWMSMIPSILMTMMPS